MKIYFIKTIVVSIFLFISQISFCAEVKLSPNKKETYGSHVRLVLEGRKFDLNKYGSGTDEVIEFCKSFLSDLVNNVDVTYVEPIWVGGNNYVDSTSSGLGGKCQNLNEIIWYPQRIQNEIFRITQEKGSLSEEKKGIFESQRANYYSTTDNRLYKVNINNENKDGDEYVFHGSGFYSKEYVKKYGDMYPKVKNSPGFGYLKSFESDAGRYYIINPEDCSKSHHLTIHDPYNYSMNHPLDNFNGIIKYKNIYYIFDLFEPDINQGKHKKVKTYNLKLFKAKSRVNKFIPMCVFTESSKEN